MGNLTITSAAREAGVSRQTVYYWIDRGLLAADMDARKPICAEVLKKFLAALWSERDKPGPKPSTPAGPAPRRKRGRPKKGTT